jgi:hypothetical protein
MDPATRKKTMKQCIRFALLGALGAGILSAQAPAKRAPAALPDAAMILDHYVEVTGGQAAYEKHRTEIMTGLIEFPAQGLKGKLTRYAAPPDKEYSLVELEGIGSIESGISGGVAWEKSVLLGPRLKSGDEKDQALREAHFNSPIEWRNLYPQVMTAGTQSINGEDCYEVVLTPPAGKPEHQFYSRKTGLLLRTTAVASSQMGDVPVEVDLDDYRSFGGVLIPTRSKQRAGGQELSITIDQVRVNETLPTDRFDAPGDIAAMIRKASGPAAP